MPGTLSPVGVAAAGLKARSLAALSDWEALLAHQLGQAEAGGAKLLVLPALTGLFCWQAVTGAPPPRLDAGAAKEIARHGAAVAAAWLDAACRAAREAACWLVPGSALVPTAAGIAHKTWLIDPAGRIAGQQEQTHRAGAVARAIGLAAATELNVCVTDLGRVGLLLDTDVWYPEAARILALQGADMLLAPVAHPMPYTAWQQLAGLWQQVQQNQIFGVEAGLGGWLGGRAFAARPALFAPCEATAGGTGVLAGLATGRRGPVQPEADLPVDDRLVGAALDPADLQESRRRFPIFSHLNPELYARHMPRHYEQPPPPGPPRTGSVATGLPGAKLKEKLFAAWLHYRSRPGPLAGHLLRTGAPHPGERPAQVAAALMDRVRVAAVQMRLELLSRPEDYADLVHGYVREAVAAGAGLICFPEDAATHLVGLLPDIEQAAAGGSVADALQELGGELQVADIFRFIGPATLRIYRTVFSTLAAAYGVWIAAGSALLPTQQGRVVNRAHLFDPAGRLIASQDKCHLMPMEAEWGLSPGADLQVVDTPLGRLGLPVCMDATYFETFRILALQGAQIVIVPTADPAEYNYWLALRGAWPRSQESQVFAVHSCMVGELLGLKLTGRSAVFAPLALTPHGDGVLAQVDDPEKPGVAVADVDLAALAELQRTEPVAAGLNPALYRRYLPAAYAGRGGRTDD